MPQLSIKKRFKIVLVGVLIFVVPVITLLILFFKDNYFIPWLTFLTGMLGGFGLSKVSGTLFKEPEMKNPIEKEDLDL